MGQHWFLVYDHCGFITFTSTVLSDQDGFARMFADGTSILARKNGWKGQWVDDRFLKKIFVWTVLTAIPIATYLFAGEPVALLKLAGGIEATHIPVVTGVILYLNHQRLPKELRANRWCLF